VTTIIQLNPPFHVWVPESQDHGLALFLIDYHVEEHLYWVCAMEKTGEIWTLANDKVRADINRSIGRVYARYGTSDQVSPPLRVRGSEVHLNVPSTSRNGEGETQGIHGDRESETADTSESPDLSVRIGNLLTQAREQYSATAPFGNWARVDPSSERYDPPVRRKYKKRGGAKRGRGRVKS
jgi:hypothetical protein